MTADEIKAFADCPRCGMSAGFTCVTEKQVRNLNVIGLGRNHSERVKAAKEQKER